MTEWDSTRSNINLKKFDMNPSFGGASIPIKPRFYSKQKRRKEKIQNIFKIKKPLI
jgi:hypothetical protein